MSRKSVSIAKIQTALEHSLVSNFVRLCAAEGVDAENANRELEIRLDELSQLNSTCKSATCPNGLLELSLLGGEKGVAEGNSFRDTR